MRTSSLLDSYRPLVGDAVLARIYATAEALAGVRVVHVNTTRVGGGVAEILRVLIPLMEELGIPHHWKVIQLDEVSNHFTSRIVDMLQGSLPGEVPQEEKEQFLERLAHSVSWLPEDHGDLHFIHDFQLVPLAHLYPQIQLALWFCHVDTANPNEHALHYIKEFLDAYRLVGFNSSPSIFKGLSPAQTHVVTLGIDPFLPKHALLPKERGMAVLARCGIDPTRPLIAQISRFDRWKNPWQAVDVYRRVKQREPSVQLAMVGAMEAADDLNAHGVLADLRTYVGHDPDVHLLSDASLIKYEEVNAFQRYASVVLQRSTREGFGLTVTEAMWKNQPVVGTSATGLRTQIIHGETGYIVDDTDACAECTLELLRDRPLWQRLGAQAHERVRTRFLFPMMISDYLDALARVCGL